MNRRELLRRTILGTSVAAVTGIAPAREIPPGYDASKELAAEGWKPVFLDPHQNETLIAVSNIIIPETDTPGAKSALVNRFIDKLLAAEAREIQREFMESLSFLDAEAFSRYRQAFLFIEPEQQVEIITFMAYPHTLVTWKENLQGEYRGHAHFQILKDWISRAYYSSEPGMRALGYTGPPHGEFEGCTHPESHTAQPRDSAPR